MNDYFIQPISKEIFKNKYCLQGEQSIDEVFKGVAVEIAGKEAGMVDPFYQVMKSGAFIPAGRILANARIGSPIKNYNNCFEETAKVLTSKGLVSIASVQKGDKVLTHRGNWKTVINTMKRYYEGDIEVYQSPLFTHDIIVTPEHPFYQGNEEWAESKDVKKVIFSKRFSHVDPIVLDLVTIIGTDNINYDDNNVWYHHIKRGNTKIQGEHVNRYITVTKDLAYLLGVFVGDGSTFKNNPLKYDLISGINFCFNKKDVNNRDKILELLELIFGIKFNINITGNEWHYLRKANYPISKFFRILCGESSKTKKIPEFIWEQSEDIQMAFIQGVIDTDGTINKNGSIELRMASEFLIKSLQTLANLVGIYPTIRVAHTPYIKGKKFVSYSWYLSVGQSNILRNNSAKVYDDNRCQKVIPEKSIVQKSDTYTYTTKFKKTTKKYNDYVYNISVEDDESYVVNNVIVHNCFTIDIEDSIDGITTAVKEYMTIQSVGGGVGFNISKLRPKGTPISKGGESSGPISFLEVFDTASKQIKVGGSRRAASIVILNVDHPDIEEFITCKHGDDNKKLTQFNMSVGITSEFMRAVQDNKDWNLVFNGKVYKTIKAKYLYDLLCENAWKYNEPGALFFDAINEDNNASDYFMIDRCNPCGEIVMDSYSLCCLSSINLSKLIKEPFTEEASFDYGQFEYLVRTGIHFLDNVLDATDYPVEKIQINATKWRRIGLGITGLADAMLMLGIRYGSEDSVALVNEVGMIMAYTAYDTSASLAKEKGAFPAYTPKIAEAGFIRKLPPEIRDKIRKYGLRNVGLLTIPPTGTTSFTVGNNCSSGIEPIFALEYERFITQEDGTRKGEMVYDYGWLKYKEVFGDTRKEYVVTAHEVPIEESITIQSTFQKWIDHSISKTLNIPEETTLDEYRNLFMFAWEQGLKGVTSFREGTMQGILSTKKKSTRISPKRPKDLECDIYTMQVNKQRVVALVGLYNGLPYEVFITDDPDKELRIKNRSRGIIRKVSSGKYDLILDETCVIEDIGQAFNHEWGALGRMISTQLRHGIPIQFTIEQLNKTKMFGTFMKGVARLLKKYMEVVVERKDVCPSCGEVMVNEGGCSTCKSCGYSKCD